MIDNLGLNNNLAVGQEIDQKNFESFLMKKRFFDLKNIETEEAEEKFKLFVKENNELDPAEKQKFEVDHIRKAIKKMRVKKNSKFCRLKKPAFLGFQDHKSE